MNCWSKKIDAKERDHAVDGIWYRIALKATAQLRVVVCEL